MGTDNRKPWRVFRGILATSGALAASLLVLLAGAYGFFHTDPGRAWAAQLLSRVLSTPGETQIRIGRLEGSFHREIRFYDIAVADRQGPWLAADSVTIRWRPAALFSGELEVGALQIQEVNVRRLPAGDAAKPSEPSQGLPSLPFAVTLKRLTVEAMRLGAEVLGTPASFRIDGAAEVRDSAQLSASLSVERTDGKEGSASLTALYTPRTDRLEIDGRISEPPGGLLARALDLENLPAVSASLSGAGLLDNWKGDLRIVMEGLASASAGIELSRTEALKFKVSGFATAPRSSSALPWRLLRDGVTFKALGSWQPQQVLVLDEAVLDGPAGTIGISGKLDAAGLVVDAEGNARFNDPAILRSFVPGVAVSALAIKIDAQGAFLNPIVRATATAEAASLAELVTKGLRLEVQSLGPLGQSPIAVKAKLGMLRTPDLEGRMAEMEATFRPGSKSIGHPLTGGFVVRGGIEDLHGRALAELEPLLGRRFEWTLDGVFDGEKQRIEAKNLTLTAGRSEASGSGVIRFEDGYLDMSLRMNLSDLSGLTQLVGIGVAGRGTVEGRLVAALATNEIRADLTGRLHDLQVDQDMVQTLLTSTVSLAAGIQIASDGTVNLNGLRMESSQVRLTGDIAITGKARVLSGRYKAVLPESARLSSVLGIRLRDHASVTGRLEGTAADPGLSGELVLTKGVIEDIDFEPLEITYTAKTLVTGPHGTIRARSVLPAGEVDLSTAYQITDSQVQLSRLRVQSQGATAQGTVTMPRSGGPLSAMIALRADRLAPWLGMAGLPGGGSLTADVNLSASGPRQVVDIEATLAPLELQLNDGGSLEATRTEVRFKIPDLARGLAGTGRVSAAGLRAGVIRLKSLVLDVEGGLSAVDYHLEASGTANGPLRLGSSGTVRLEEGAVSMEVKALRGQVFGRPVELQAPATFLRQGQATEITAVVLDYGTALMRASARVSSERIAIDATIDSLPLATFAPLAPVSELSGTLNAKITVDGTRDHPTGKAEVKLAGLKAATAEDRAAFGLRLSAGWRDGRILAKGAITGISDDGMNFSLDLPFRLREGNGFSFHIPQDDSLSGDLNWQANIGTFWPIVPLPGHRLAGSARLSLSMTGTAAAPKITGTVRLDKGQYENLESGTRMKELTVELALDKASAVLRQLEATDGAGGKLVAKGEASFDYSSGNPFRLTAQMTDFAAVRRDEVTAVTDAKLDLHGTLDKAVLSGRIEPRAVEIRIPPRLPGEVVQLDVVEIGEDGKPEARESKDKPPQSPMVAALDVTVSVPRRVFVRGRGLDSEWGGDLEVTGTLERPSVEGALTLVRGQLNALTKNFRLKNGRVGFPGGSELNPELDITAEHQAKNLLVTARVTGSAANPNISFSSNPSLPRDEIVTRMLFGKSTNQLTAVEAAQVAVAVAGLTRTGPSADGILGFARGLLGADVLRVEQSSSGGTTGAALSAGKYLTDDIYIDVKRGLTDASGSVGVQVEVTPNISVESEVGHAGESNIGVKFKWDY